jgi:hypothetical protein
MTTSIGTRNQALRDALESWDRPCFSISETLNQGHAMASAIRAHLAMQEPASERCDHPMDVRCVRCDPVGVAQSGKGHAPKHTIVEPASEPAPASDAEALGNARRNLIDAGNKLSFAAQTSGGTAGRDEGLVAAVEGWTKARDAERAVRRIVQLEPAPASAPEKYEGQQRDEAATFVIEALAKALGVTDYEQCDGTETWEGDVSGTVYSVLKAARVIDDETGEIARHQPAPASAPSLDGLIQWHVDQIIAPGDANAQTADALRELARARAAPASAKGKAMDMDAITSRFLQWKLPENFNPDGGITFERDYNQNTPWPAKHEPVGTNLFTFEQAKAMFEYVLAGVEPAPASALSDPGELPDDMRCPLHSLRADVDYLVARIRKADDEEAGLLKGSIQNRLSQIEEAAYRMNAPASAPSSCGAEKIVMEAAVREGCTPAHASRIARRASSDDFTDAEYTGAIERIYDHSLKVAAKLRSENEKMRAEIAALRAPASAPSCCWEEAAKIADERGYELRAYAHRASDKVSMGREAVAMAECWRVGQLIRSMAKAACVTCKASKTTSDMEPRA